LPAVPHCGILSIRDALLLKTILLFIYTAISMVILMPFGIVFFIASFVGLKQPMAVFVSFLARSWAWSLIVLTGCKLSVRGRENIPVSGSVCFVSNHEGIFDIVLALALFKRPFGFVAKKELSFVPLLNVWIWLLGGHFIDRKNLKKAFKTINKGVEHIKKGGAMVIFPEGTRSKGRGLQDFKPGSFKLATQSGALIVPVAINGSYGVFEKNYRAASVPVHVVFSPPIETAALSLEEKKRRLSDRVHEVIKKALTEAPEPAARD
jgi:1-acyl-sn-glycerol-3-phosphate acyltransferase